MGTVVSIELADDQAVALERLSQVEKRPISQIVREMIASHLDSHTDTPGPPDTTERAPVEKPEPPESIRHDPVLSAAFGAWKGLLNEDAVDYQRRLRAEWDR